MKNTKVGFIYRDAYMRRRLHGIFSPGLDRFILIDDSDVWVTLETAEILCSKLPTVAYVLHTIKFNLGNHNCLEYSIPNKTNQTVGKASIVNRRQNPTLRFIQHSTNPIEWTGPNPDYESQEGVEALKKLQEYAEFVLDTVYAMKVTGAMTNWMDCQRFIDAYIPRKMLQTIDGGMKGEYDRSDTERGVFFEIRHALHISLTVEEAMSRIEKIWNTCAAEQEFVMKSFYTNWGRQLPESLKGMGNFVPVTLSPSIL
jgi:hypothetical protein